MKHKLKVPTPPYKYVREPAEAEEPIYRYTILDLSDGEEVETDCYVGPELDCLPEVEDNLDNQQRAWTKGYKFGWSECLRKHGIKEKK